MNRTEREQFYIDHGLWTGQSLGLLPATGAARWPERELVYCEGRRYTYAEFHRWTNAVARDLHARGLRRGDRLLVQMTNGMEVMLLQFAAWRIGAVCVPVVPLYRLRELRSIINELRPTMFAASHTVGSRQLAQEVDEAIAEAGLQPLARYQVGGDALLPGWVRVPGLPAALAGGQTDDERDLPRPGEVHECAVILYTSGSTAAPKGAMLTPRGILSCGISYRQVQGLNHELVALAASPLAHCAAMSTALINPMLVGGRMVVMSAWKPEEAVALIEQERISFLGTVVTFLQDLVECYEKGLGGAHRINLIVVGGAALPASLIERADAQGMKAINQFGMTEIAANATMGQPTDSQYRRANFSARVMFGTEMQAVDEARQPLPPGEIGELRVRSPQMMLGYTDAKVSAEQLDEDGWFYTGDLGSVDAEGWLRITGRKKDIINRGGEKFSAQDIELAIMNHPSIAVAAVVGAPHARFGEVPAAFVKLRPGAQWPGPEALQAHMEAQRMARSKIPVVWQVVDDYPRTATGKIQKQDLVALLPSTS